MRNCLDYITSRPCAKSTVASLALVTLCALEPGCTSGPTESTLRRESEVGLEFPDRAQLVPWGVFHGISVTLEFEDAVDPYPVIPQRRRGIELYKFDEDHRIEFRNTVLHVNNEPYPVGSKAALFMFRPRRGDWEMHYRGVPITFRNNGWWQPVVLRDKVYGFETEENLRETQRSFRQRAHTGKKMRETWADVDRPLTEEALKVGQNLIIFRPDDAYLEVNEKHVPIRDDLSISIDGRGRVTYQY